MARAARIRGEGGDLVLYASGKTRLEVRLDEDTVWLSQLQLAKLFGRDKSVISRHLGNVFKSGELERDSAVAFFATTAADGKTYEVEHFNLDAILSVGYRVNSKQGTRFRIWATSVLRDHLVKGYTLNEARLRAERPARQHLGSHLESFLSLLVAPRRLRLVAGKSTVGETDPASAKETFEA